MTTPGRTIFQHDTITDALANLAAYQPAAPALHVLGRKSLTYGYLGEQIRYVRERLKNWDIEPGDVVAGFMPSRDQMAIACVTFPSSCTFAPLGSELTADVCEQLIGRMGARAVVLPKGQEHPLRVAARRLDVGEIDVISDRDAPAGLFALELGRKSGSLGALRRERRSELAYVLTSSGTTGRPKLVPSTHAATLLYAKTAREWLQYSPADVGCHLSPIHLGNGLRSGLINPLLAGTSIVCLPESDPDAFFGCLQDFRPSCMNAGFALYRAILRRAPEYKEEIAHTRFRFLRAGAGRLRPEEIERLQETFSAPLLVGFSSVEAVIAHDPLPPRPGKREAAGLPLLNEIAVRMDSGEIAWDGTGEIVVRGPQVFPGYLDDPDLTAASFAGDWFRTGDLGRIDADGYIYVLGRIKEIINRGGEKISPVEIDAILEGLPGVAEAGTFGVPHASLGEEVVAAVALHPGANIAEAQVIEAVRRRAGFVKAPRRVYFVDRIPRTGNGKVLRRELPRFLGLDETGAPPRDGPNAMLDAKLASSALSPLESALAGLWTSLLHVTNIGREDNFFLLGGDSLHGKQLLAQIEDLFGVILPIQSLFGEAITLAGMAQTIDVIRRGHAAEQRQADVPGAPEETDRSSASFIPRRTSSEPCVLTPAQWRTWFLAKLDSGSAAYHQSRAHRLIGSIRVEALRASLLAIIRRHDILRTVFTTIEDEPRQIVRETAVLDFDYLDLSHGVEGDALSALLSGFAQRPFDFENGPLTRFRLIRLAEEEHIFVRVWHHIISDGWSTGIFERELSTAYHALAQDHAFEMPPLALQYADYAAWEHERLSGRTLSAHVDYWKKQLANLPPLNLPTDRPHPALQSFRGGSVEIRLPPALSGALKEIGKREDATLFMTLCALCGALLSRSCAQEDMALGVPMANRDAVAFQEIIGPFVNTIVLRLDLSGDPTVQELLQRTKETAIAAYAHQNVPFERLVEELKPAKALNRNPLFQVLFSLQNAPREGLQLPGVEAVTFKLPQETAKFDLSFFFADSPEGLEARLEYNADLFDRATAQRLLEHYRVFIEGAVGDLDVKVSQLPLLGAQELQQVVVGFNDTAMEIPRDLCIHDLIARQAAQTPDAVALSSEHGQMTYGELNAAANRIAHFLMSRGAGPDVPVCIYHERTPRLVAAILGILKAGSAYVPLDPSYPAERLQSILEDARAPIVLTQDSLKDALPEFAGQVVSLDREAQWIMRESANDPIVPVNPHNLAYALFTSGSTGRPKGVSLEHRTAVAFIHWAKNVFTPQELAVVLFSTSVCFDVSMFEMFVTLSAGGRIILARDVFQLPDLAARNEITLMNVVPSAMAELIRAGGIPASIRTVNFAGEPLPESLVEQTYTTTRADRVFNLYGPTETSYATFAELHRGDRVSIGKPIANARVYILDVHQKPVPIGAPGEIYIGGDGVARGYLHRPDLTAEKFIADPFSRDSDGHLYRTGDLGRFLSDGNIEFLGRSDRQVKIRGYRIEPGEIEAALARHTAVANSVIVESDSDSGERRLVAYVVLRPGHSADTADLRAFLKRTLPDYMLPSLFVFLDKLPTLPSGKLDRHALPQPQPTSPGGNRIPPRDQQQYQLVRIWENLLSVSPIGIRDDFFELGGDSLLAVRLLLQIEMVYGKKLSISALFADPTVEGLADAISKQVGDPERSPLVKIQSLGSKTPLFFLHGDFSGGGAYSLKLARLLGSDQPFYALQPLGLENEEFPASIEAMAEPYLDILKKVQPRGPYLLAGYCAGGLAAFEVARRLKAQGEKADVVLIDPVGRKSHFRWFWRVACRLSRRGTFPAAAKAPLASDDKAVSAEALIRNLEKKGVYYRWMSRAFAAHSYPGSVTLILATGRPNSGRHERRRARVARAWGRIASDVTVHVVPGNHITCVTQHIGAIAEHIKSALAKAE